MVGTFTLLTSCKGGDAVAIQLVLNRGTINEAFDGNNHKVGDTIKLPIPEKEMAYFAGWYADADFKTKVDNDYKPTEGGLIKLYAKFVNKIELEYNNLDSAIINNEGQYTTLFAPGFETLVLPEVTKNGYTFGGWFGDRDFTEPLTFEDINALTYSKRLYAKWDKVVGTGNPIIETFTGSSSTVGNHNYADFFYLGSQYITLTIKPGATAPTGEGLFEFEGLKVDGEGGRYDFASFDANGIYAADGIGKGQKGKLLASFGSGKTIDILLYLPCDFDDYFTGEAAAYYYVDGEYVCKTTGENINRYPAPDYENGVSFYGYLTGENWNFFKYDGFNGAQETTVRQGSIYEKPGAIESFKGATSETSNTNYADYIKGGENYLTFSLDVGATAATNPGYLAFKGTTGNAYDVLTFNTDGVHISMGVGNKKEGKLLAEYGSDAVVDVVVYFGNDQDKFTGEIRAYYFVNDTYAGMAVTERANKDAAFTECFSGDSWNLLTYYEFDGDNNAVAFDAEITTAIYQGSKYSYIDLIGDMVTPDGSSLHPSILATSFKGATTDATTGAQYTVNADGSYTYTYFDDTPNPTTGGYGAPAINKYGGSTVRDHVLNAPIGDSGEQTKIFKVTIEVGLVPGKEVLPFILNGGYWYYLIIPSIPADDGKYYAYINGDTMADENGTNNAINYEKLSAPIAELPADGSMVTITMYADFQYADIMSNGNGEKVQFSTLDINGNVAYSNVGMDEFTRNQFGRIYLAEQAVTPWWGWPARDYPAAIKLGEFHITPVVSGELPYEAPPAIEVEAPAE